MKWICATPLVLVSAHAPVLIAVGIPLADSTATRWSQFFMPE